MSFIDYMAREINFKLSYYGPGLSGKTTNLQYVYGKTSPEQRTQLISLASETERSLFFSLRPATLAPIGILAVRLHLYTVPGPVFYDASRIGVLKGADAVVFVADSQAERLEANVESYENLATNLAVHGLSLAGMPVVFQYNKRDLPSALPVAELDAALELGERPRFEASASQGLGVFDTLKAAAKLAIAPVRAQAGAGPA